MNSLRILFLGSTTATIASSNACVVLTEIEIPPPAITSRPFSVTIKFPTSQVDRRTIWPHLLWCGCRWSNWTPPPQPQAPDAITFLTNAYRDAKKVEIWQSERDFGFVPAEWEYRRYRDIDIVKSNSFSDEESLLKVFKLITEALMESASSDTLDFIYEDDSSLTDVLRWLRFAPDLIVTFQGSHETRIEFDFSTQRALVQTGDKFGFYPLDATSIREVVSVLAQGNKNPGECLLTAERQASPVR